MECVHAVHDIIILCICFSVARLYNKQLAKMEERTRLMAFRDPDPVKDNMMRGMLGEGARIYQRYCLSCHQQNGKGDGNLFPPLSGSEWVTGGPFMEKDQVITAVLNGIQVPIKVKGLPYNNVMPKFSFLSDEDIARVLTFVRNNFGNHSSLVTAGEVKAIRNQVAVSK